MNFFGTHIIAMSDNEEYFDIAVNVNVPKTTTEALFYCIIVKSAFYFPMELNHKFLKEFFFTIIFNQSSQSVIAVPGAQSSDPTNMLAIIKRNLFKMSAAFKICVSTSSKFLVS